jgi:hypothetical protein
MVVVWVCVGDGTTDDGTVDTSEDGVTSARGPGDDGAAVLVDAFGDDGAADGEVSVDAEGAGDPDAGDDDGEPGVSDGDVLSDGDGLVLVGAEVDGVEVDGVLVEDEVSDPLVALDGLLCVAGTSGSTIGGAFGGTVAFGSRFSTLTDNCCS